MRSLQMSLLETFTAQFKTPDLEQTPEQPNCLVGEIWIGIADEVKDAKTGTNGTHVRSE